MRIIKKANPEKSDELFITFLPDQETWKLEEDFVDSLPNFLERKGYRELTELKDGDAFGHSAVFKKNHTRILVEHDEQVFLTITVTGKNEWPFFLETILEYCEEKLGPIPPENILER